MVIHIHNRQRKITIDLPCLKQRLQQVLEYLSCADAELSVVLANDQFLRQLNRTYRQKDRPTNVLAFPQGPMPNASDLPLLLGDVVVSLPTAAREAREADQPIEAHVLYLVLHGILHLLGYDHERSAAAQQRMEALEQTVLTFMRSNGHD
jgi:probable rRNA maturation factor